MEGRDWRALRAAGGCDQWHRYTWEEQEDNGGKEVGGGVGDGGKGYDLYSSTLHGYNVASSPGILVPRFSLHG